MEDIKIEDLWKAVNAKAERQKAEGRELLSLRSHEEEIRQILQALRNPLKLDLLQAVERIRKLVGL